MSHQSHHVSLYLIMSDVSTPCERTKKRLHSRSVQDYMVRTGHSCVGKPQTRQDYNIKRVATCPQQVKEQTTGTQHITTLQQSKQLQHTAAASSRLCACDKSIPGRGCLVRKPLLRTPFNKRQDFGVPNYHEVGDQQIFNKHQIILNLQINLLTKSIV